MMYLGDPTLVIIDWTREKEIPGVPPMTFVTGLIPWPRDRRTRMATNNEPICYALTIGTASVQILPQNPTRKGVVFYNPGPNNIAVCPNLSGSNQNVPAVIQGAGSITLTSGQVLVMPPVAWGDATATSAWNAIASGASSALTAWEF